MSPSLSTLVSRSWLALGPTILIAPLLLGVALLAGAVIGFERERREKPAGLRTMSLVSLGAAAFTLVSLSIEGQANAGRIAAQVVTGVGFLGAGAILRGTHGVSGLTSAATVWTTAAVGMVIGAGYAPGGFALSLVVVAVLQGATALERRYFGACVYRAAVVMFEDNGGKGRVRVLDVLDEFQIPDVGRRFTDAGLRRKVAFTYCAAHRHHRALLPRLADIAEVVDLRCDYYPNGEGPG